MFDTVEPGGGVGPPLLVRIVCGLEHEPRAVVAFVLIADQHGRDTQERAPVLQGDVIRRAESGALLKPDDLTEAGLVGDVAGVINLGAYGMVRLGVGG
jgi:hypothetical protein